MHNTSTIFLMVTCQLHLDFVVLFESLTIILSQNKILTYVRVSTLALKAELPTCTPS